MKNVLRITALLSVLFLGACASGMRYSAEEIRGFPKDVQERIEKGDVSLGMTMLQVRYAWGGPKAIRLLQAGDENTERVEWMYDSSMVFKTRLIFTGNRLTEILSSQPGGVK